MGVLIDTEITRLKSVYANVFNVPAGDLIDLISTVLRLGESITTKLTTINVTAGTLVAGDITGASSFVQLISTNATPGTQTTRTAVQMIADHGAGLSVIKYRLRISNSGAGTLTLGAGSSVTLTGTMTVATNTCRDFIVTLDGPAATATIQAVGQGTYS